MEKETFFKWKITCCLKSSAGTPRGARALISAAHLYIMVYTRVFGLTKFSAHLTP